jgi:hypothetical protein
MGARMLPVVKNHAGSLAAGAVFGQLVRAANEYLTPMLKQGLGLAGLDDYLSVGDAQRALPLGDYLSVGDAQRALPLGEMAIAEELAGG